MPSYLEQGLEFEQFLLTKHFKKWGYKKNRDDYAIDLVKPGWPSIECKREGSPRAARVGSRLKFVTIQIFVDKQRGPRELSGPWKAIKECPSAMYIVGEKTKTFNIVFAGIAYEVAKRCEWYKTQAIKYVKGQIDKPWYLREERNTQKIYALVPLKDLDDINRGMDWIQNVYLGERPE